jgi:2-polyprenyl-3-methyl-5-hydroxy-6-metoxy-1,4-benzoquinol methylase
MRSKFLAEHETGMRWFEDPEFWDLTASYIFPETRIQDGPTEIKAIDALLHRETGNGFTPGTRVLDVPCGPGRHAVALAQRGCIVSGVDLTEAHIIAASDRAKEAGVSLTLTRADMYSHSFDGPYDVALNLFSSLGYTCDEADDVRLLRAIHDALRPGGVLVVDSMGKEVLARILEPVRYLTAGGWIAKSTVHLEDSWRIVRTTMELSRDGEERTVEFRHLLYGASDLIRVFESAGFDVSVFGGYSGEAYDREAHRLVVVGRRRGPS